MADISKAILSLKNDAHFQMEDSDDINTITWLDGNPTNITNEQITTKQAEMTQAEADATAQKATNKANAKAKLIAGEALTEAEADTIVL